MEIPEKEWNELRGKVAALEKEQLTIKKYIEEKLNDDEELVERDSEMKLKSYSKTLIQIQHRWRGKEDG